MEAPRLSRQAIRAIVENHAARQYAAERDGRFYAVQNDINDELAEARQAVARRAGELEAERFQRIYTEEVLAYERDFRLNPAKGAERMCGVTTPERRADASLIALAAPRRANGAQAIFAVILIIAGAAIFF